MVDRKEYMKKYCQDNCEKMRANSMKWIKNNPEKRKQQKKRHYEKRKQFVDDYKLSEGCQICGYNKCAAALDFHHPSNNKDFGIGANWDANFRKLKEEINKCIILCGNCHEELHDKERGN